MNSLTSVRNLLIDYLKEASRNISESLNVLLIMGEKEFTQKVYDAFFNLIADPAQSPSSITNILDTYTSGLEGFSTSTCLQTVIGFACFESLAIRRPAVIDGPWETLLWIIVKYSSIANTAIGNGLTEFKKTNTTTLRFITELGSPELCPNPLLRLELLRFMRSFNCRDLYYDCESYRNTILNTLFEICDNFTVNDLPNFSPIDLQFVMEDNSINMEYIMNDCESEAKQFEIIVTVLKLTKNFALIEKEKLQRLNNQGIEDEFWHPGLEKQLAACLSFCGLLSGDDSFDQEAYLHNLVQIAAKNSFLLNYIIDTVDTIKHVSLCFPDNYEVYSIVLYKKDKLLHTLFKGHVKNFPKIQYKQEIYGGVAPAVEYRLRYFQNNTRDKYSSHDSNYDSESYVSDENDYIYPSNTRGNDSEIDDSD